MNEPNPEPSTAVALAAVAQLTIGAMAALALVGWSLRVIDTLILLAVIGTAASAIVGIDIARRWLE